MQLPWSYKLHVLKQFKIFQAINAVKYSADIFIPVTRRYGFRVARVATYYCWNWTREMRGFCDAIHKAKPDSTKKQECKDEQC